MLKKHILIKGVYSTGFLSFDMLKSNVFIEKEAIDVKNRRNTVTQ